MAAVRRKRGVWLEITFPVILVVLVLMVVSGQKMGEPRRHNEPVSRMSEGWYYMKDGEKIPVILPTVIEQKEGDSLTLYYDDLTERDEDAMLTTRAAEYKMGVYLDGKRLYQYEDSEFPRNVQMASKFNCNAALAHDLENKTLSIVYQNTDDGIYHIPEVFKGSRPLMLLFLMKREAFLFGTVFAMCVLAVITIAVAFYMKRVKMQDKRFVDCAFFLLICGLWFTTDSSVVQMLSGPSPITRYISFYAFMLLSVPFLYFVRHTAGMEKYWQIDVCIYAFYLNAAVQSVLNYLHIFEFIDMLFVTHLLLAGGVVLLILLMVKEYKATGEAEILTILYAFAALAIGGVAALILYWLLEIPYYGMFFDCGIIVFVVMLVRSLIINVVENSRFKAETLVYRRLEKEDRLTGLKNRKAYDEYIMELEQTAEKYQDVVLIFMDLNHLKEINDRYGYGCGNEAIITAARCIERAYGSEGICFRIGGDEFVAVLPNETAGNEELFERLNNQLLMCNKNSRYRLSVARGISRLRDENGYLKTVSDWKREADISMYENKGWVRR